MDQIPDIIAPNLKILFIGFNPGLRSATTGHHFAGHSNKFWKLLAAAGLTPYQFKADEDGKLLALGLGITNIVARPSRAASEITKEEYRSGREALKNKIIEYRPEFACFAGIGVYKEFSGCTGVVCGLQPSSVVPGGQDYVVPSPSGLTRILFADQLVYYRELARLVQESSTGTS